MQYCCICLEIFDWFDGFSKLRKCIKCKKFICDKCIKRTKQAFMNQYIVSVCNDCFTEMNLN